MTVTVVPDTGNHLAGYFNPTDNQGGICRGDLSWSLNFEVWH